MNLMLVTHTLFAETLSTLLLRFGRVPDGSCVSEGVLPSCCLVAANMM